MPGVLLFMYCPKIVGVSHFVLGEGGGQSASRVDPENPQRSLLFWLKKPLFAPDYLSPVPGGLFPMKWQNYGKMAILQVLPLL